MAARDLWEAFVAANEVDAVEAAFAALLEHAAATGLRGQGLALFTRLKEKIVPDLNFRQRKLFNDLHVQIGKRVSYLERFRASSAAGATGCTGPAHGRMLICGAGPVGLRTAVEAAMLGFTTTVVEKRTTFSRANILTLWERTWADVLSLGAKCYMPHLPAHARDTGVQFYMGTRELQLTFLKTALLCGVEVHYGTELAALVPPKAAGESWSGCIRPFVRGGRQDEQEGLKHAESGAQDSAEAVSADVRAAVEGLKPIGKAEDYQKTYKCNAVEHAAVSQEFLSGGASIPSDDETLVSFDSYIIAEGEWSNTTKKLAFDKTIDKFAQALGLVINMTYDKEDPAQKDLKSFLGQRSELGEANIKYEFMEYLKGETHYIVLAVKKESLLSYGALREDKPNSKLLLQASNLDLEKLRVLARTVARACGLPANVEFYPHNPVQLFDYSSRARCFEAVKLLTGGGYELPGIVPATSGTATAAVSAAQCGAGQPALVMPVGDALMEPFWPQGLGSNRGFHTALNAVNAALWAREQGLASGAAEARFAYQMVVMTAFSRRDLLPFDSWSVDPTTRFVKELMGLARDKIRKSAEGEDSLPDRIAKLPMTQYG